MKIDIITMHAMHNPGSVFQAYALQKYLMNKGEDAWIIDYRPEYFFSEGNGMSFALKKVLFHKAYASRQKKFDDFIEKNMRLTKRFTTYQEFETEKWDADCYVVGSDQLWNTDFECGNDKAYFLDFVQNGRKVSYATSVGKAVIDEKNKEVLRKYLPNFDTVSVREKSTADSLNEELGIEVKFVCDPVFLLKKQDYERFNYQINQPKYVMVYLAPKSNILDFLVEEYRRKGYKIILIGGFTKRCKCDMHIVDAGPEDFLSYLSSASVVISDSFHATAFSLIFHKEFWTILPERNGERIKSLLEVVGLSNHIAEKNVNISDVIDWDEVDEKIKGYIKESEGVISGEIEGD